MLDSREKATLLAHLSIVRALEKEGLGEFKVLPYGSVAQGLCDFNSDLDVCIDFGLSLNSRISPAQANILKLCGFSDCVTGALSTQFFSTLNRIELQFQLLSTIISPALEPICNWKEDAMHTKVPLV